jgi:mxaK protein
MDYLKRLPGWLYVSLAILACAAVYHGVAIYRHQALNFAMANPDDINLDENTPAILIFAKAWHLDKSGHPAEAIRLYSSLINVEDTSLRARALHNLATIYLKDAAQRWNAHGVLEAPHVSTDVELAKQYYRESLRLDPGSWDSRFNLEYAYRITPPPKEKAKADFQGSKSSVFSTLPGLPGGGP